jgi:hypothetical protein
MMNRLTRLALRVLVALALVTGASSRPLAAQNPPAEAAAPAPLARAVRVALGHANLDEARRVVQASRESAAKKAVAAALIAIYEGKDDGRVAPEPRDGAPRTTRCSNSGCSNGATGAKRWPRRCSIA